MKIAERARKLEFLLPVLFYVGLGRALQETRGMYSLRHIVRTTVGLAIIGAWMALRERKPASELGWSDGSAGRALSVALLVQSIWLATQPLITQRDNPAFYLALKVSLGVSAVLAAALCGLAWFQKPRPDAARAEKTFVRAALAAGAVLLIGKVFVLIDSRHPWIDVFTCSTEAADYLLRGMNPYVQGYTDIYHGILGKDYVSAFGYWPGVLLPQTLARVVFRDVRAIYIVADAITSFALYRIARSVGIGRRPAALVPLLWLTFPVALHVLEMAWVDTLLVLAAALMTWAALGRRWALAGAALGWFCAVKQYSVFFALLTGVWVLCEFGWPAARRLTLSAVAVFAGLMLPFVAWNPREFISRTVFGVLQLEMRKDSYSWPAALMREWHIPVSGHAMTAAYLGALGVGTLVLARASKKTAAWGASLVLTYGVVFLMGKQSFVNYYYLLAFFALLYLPLRFGEPAA